MKATNYSKLKTYERAQVNGLTKKLNSYRFGQENKTITKNTFMISLGLKHIETNYGVNGEVYHFEKNKAITRMQTSFGKQWLKAWFFNSKGLARKGKRTANLDPNVLLIASKVTRFKFVGVIGFMNSFNEELSYAPIYRTYDRKGNFFDYAPLYWGAPVIIDGSYDGYSIETK